MTSEYVLKWLEEEKVLEFMLNRSTTPVELVRHINSIFELLGHLNVLDIEKHLGPLWQLIFQQQHEVCLWFSFLFFSFVFFVLVFVFSQSSKQTEKRYFVFVI